MSEPSPTSGLSDSFKQLWADIDPALLNYREEAKALRASVEPPSESDSLDTIHARMVGSRRALDRMEAILAELGLIRSRLRQLVAELQESYDEAWRKAFDSTRVGEYMSAKEKDAQYALKSLDQLASLRKGEKWLNQAEEVYDYVNLKYRGLLSAHRDYETRIRIITLPGGFER